MPVTLTMATAWWSITTIVEANDREDYSPVKAYKGYMTKTLLLWFVPLFAFAADVSGQWNMHMLKFGEEFAAARVELKAEGSKLTGTLNELKLEGTVEGDRVRITAKRPNGTEWGKFDGMVQGDEISGTVKQGDDESGWKARRAKTGTAQVKTHVFE